jgi:hypothetical protein
LIFLVCFVRCIAQLGRIIFKARLEDETLNASLKVIWWPGGTIKSEVHVTRRPKPRENVAKIQIRCKVERNTCNPNDKKGDLTERLEN